ncbi:FG-GAP-like repeat-containing protein [Bizionia myxarmorum]|uniref:T9SS type A sorting domain-containing protein n=1 Tax=Bizionia myxarmorum TaxID=291186 RepID=A0A5D0REN3_9FLAO|nr:FG-GAP-like repeat-containing protein [Bizionia myxarmorum]TYB79416.1 T9SS type A sorting domain-containing protein [Bizionia myxarmorum]
MRENQLFKGLLGGLFFLTCALQTSAQVFQRAEAVSGLGNLEQNSGVAVADFDGDNAMDIFVVAEAIDRNGVERTHSKLYKNNNDGSFTDVTVAAGLNNMLINDYSQDGVFYSFDGFKQGAFWGDYNNDGFPDLFITNTFNVLLYQNNGDGTFANITATAGFNLASNCQYMGATWFDYDNDGYLDIYINDWGGCSTNLLYHNNADGTFSDVTVAMGIAEITPRSSFTAMPFDFNGDGYMDLYVSNDFDAINYLYLNQAGTGFIEDANAVGLDNNFDDMGISMCDYNNDGFFDFFITGIDEIALFTNTGTNTFIEQSVANNIAGNGWAWGNTLADFDLDGDEDLFIANGYTFENRNAEYNVYYKNRYVEGQNNFENATVASNLHDLTISIEAVDFDYDNDGDLDLYLTNSDITSFLYENTTLNVGEPNPIHYFKLSLEGTTSNKSAIGTEVSITTNLGTFKRYFTGVGFLGQSIKPVHFGLNTETEISEVKIKWPSGLIETYTNIVGDSHFKATEGVDMVNLNISPSVKVLGCTDITSCSYNPLATVDDGSCTYLPASAITGTTTVGFLREENYTYNLTDPNSVAKWTVSGGEIISGHGTSTVKVKWGVNTTGKISVTEKSVLCSSPVASLNVNIVIYETQSDVSIARLWNETLLSAIRKDFARPTVHARNLFHTSVAMYDTWAIYDKIANPTRAYNPVTYIVGNTLNGFTSTLEPFIPAENNQTNNINKAVSYAMYRLLMHRFQNSPGAFETQERFNFLMSQLGYSVGVTSTDYTTGDAAALGNYIGQILIDYGNSDGAREATSYDNAYYLPVNPPLAPAYEAVSLTDPNRWQSLSLDTYIDQSGNLIDGDVINFLSPEWGNVLPFAMNDGDKDTFMRDGDTYNVYHNPSAPPYIDNTNTSASSEAYKWNFSMVSIWGAHLDPTDGVMMDISPNAIGNTDISAFPSDYSQYENYYDYINGGDPGTGRNLNPVTNQPYQSQVVPRGDYTRVLAEFWADGPDSETPPGHWFTLLNQVSDHPLFQKKFNGVGPDLDPIEWDVKSYFILSGAMHDAAITAWGIKGWYDYIRPISAIRYMADLGQSSDDQLVSYHPQGIKLEPGYIEIVQAGDPLAGGFNQNVGKIKLFSWKGHANVNNTDTDTAGVGWILSENWWPYQRPSFVTPPFAGFISGHSTYSRAGAEVMTLITGDEYFPGGVAEFVARKDEFLVFENGPSMDVTLQWATYRDASDQCSLSRIWGGIHPPADDIPGRLIGETVGIEAYIFALPYFKNFTLGTDSFNTNVSTIYPNPVASGGNLYVTNASANDNYKLYDVSGRLITISNTQYDGFNGTARITIPPTTATGVYILSGNNFSQKIIVGSSK